MPHAAKVHRALPPSVPCGHRPNAHRRGYNRRWQRASKVHLLLHPLCAECDRGGVLRAASVVDHVRPHKGDQALFWDAGNWQSLCKSCHDGKTARERRAEAAPAGG